MFTFDLKKGKVVRVTVVTPKANASVSKFTTVR